MHQPDEKSNPHYEDLKNANQAFFKFNTPSTASLEVNESLNEELLKIQNERLKQLNKDIEDNRNLRNQYANRCFWFMCVWCILVFSFVILQGFSILNFVLSDVVLSTLIGGTTISIIGLVGFIMKGLFTNDKKSGE